VVDAEPQTAEAEEHQPLAPGRPDPLARDGERDSEQQEADDEAAEGERAAGDVDLRAADDYERAGPGDHGDGDRDEHGGGQLAFHAPTVRVREDIHRRDSDTRWRHPADRVPAGARAYAFFASRQASQRSTWSRSSYGPLMPIV